ncbi:MAG: MFS transporter [Chloroflexi bacterium]|nr:MFS transporter [Chloroflexota bacterium]MBP7045362.1 MFS transporter [Chloroflexota bacterium]
MVSQLGDWFNLLASAEIITQLTNNGVAISYLFLARFLPLFLFSPLAGVVADRFNRRTILILSDVLRALTVLGFLFIRTSGQIWLFYVLTVFQFILSALFTPTRNAVLANVVSQEDLVTANALDSLTWSTMLAMGAFLGGIVAATLGAGAAFVLDSLTFLVSAWCISRVVVPVVARSVELPQTGWLDFVDGFRYLWQAPFILAIALVKAAGSLVWGGINVLEVAYAGQVFPLGDSIFRQVFHIENGGTATLGIIYIVSGLGTGLGPLVMRHWLGDQRQRMLLGISLGFVLLVGGIVILGRSGTLPVYLTGTLVRTVGTGTVWVFSAAMLQIMTPDRFRGRVFAFEFAALTLTQSISTFFAGYAQDSLGMGVRQVTAVFAWLGVVVGLVWMFVHWRAHVAGWDETPVSAMSSSGE